MLGRINNDSRFCRQCGIKLKFFDDMVYCDNTKCMNLKQQDRDFCEHCGQAVHGANPCGVCKKPASVP